MDQFFIDNPQYANTRAKNKAIYDAWEQIADEIIATFKGEYNGFHSTLTFTHTINDRDIYIRSSRQLQSTSESILPTIAPITTFTYVTKEISSSSPIIKIRQNSILNQIMSLGNIECQTVPFNSHYLVQSNDTLLCKQFLNQPFLKTTLKNKTIQKLIINPRKKQLHITYNKVFNTPNDVRELILFLEKVDNFL